MDAATGAVEGWVTEPPGNDSNVYWTNGATTFIVAGRDLFAPRTGLTVRFAGGYPRVLGATERYLLLQENRDARPVSTLLLVDDEFAIVGRYQLSPPATNFLSEAVFSADGTRFVVTDAQYSYGYEVDIATGATTVLDGPAGVDHMQLQRVEVQPIRGGEEYAVVAAYWSAGNQSGATAIQRYRWGGELTADYVLAGNSPDFSPDGRLVAWQDAIRWVPPQDLGGGEFWPVVVVGDATTGEPRFRVELAHLTTGDWIEQTRWLADSSALVAAVQGRPGDPPFPWTAEPAYVLIAAEGSGLEPLPERPWSRLAPPIPSPIDPGTFAAGRVGIVDLASGDAFAITDPEAYAAHVGPWADGGSHILYVLPHGGHDGGGPDLALPPRIVRPPFSPALELIVARAEPCLAVHAEPDRESAQVACLPNGTTASIAGDPTPPVPAWVNENCGDEPCPYEPDRLAIWYTEDGVWLHVAVANRTAGWVQAGFFDWAE